MRADSCATQATSNLTTAALYWLESSGYVRPFGLPMDEQLKRGPAGAPCPLPRHQATNLCHKVR